MSEGSAMEMKVSSARERDVAAIVSSLSSSFASATRACAVASNMDGSSWIKADKQRDRIENLLNEYIAELEALRKSSNKS
jgi:hypothetical protein